MALEIFTSLILLCNPDALVCKVLKAKYFPRGIYLNAKEGHSPIFTWKSVWAAQDLVKRGIRWKIGDGSKINIWVFPLLKNDNNFFISTKPIAGHEDSKVVDLLIPGTRKWDVDLLRETFLAEDVQKILSTPLPPPGFDQDRLIWHYNKNEFTR